MCAALAANPVDNVPVFAVVKEMEEPEPLDDDKLLGIAEFENEYFCGPLYQDPARSFYEALGSKPIFTLGGLGRMLLNPLKARRELKEMGERFKAKGLAGNMKGDGLTKGGIFVIAPDGDVQYTFYEDPGKGVPEAEASRILAAAKQMSFRNAAVTS